MSDEVKLLPCAICGVRPSEPNSQFCSQSCFDIARQRQSTRPPIGTDEVVALLPCEVQVVKYLKQCAKTAANSGSYFNQGVVRGLEIAAAQIENGHHRTRAIEATRPTEQTDFGGDA